MTLSPRKTRISVRYPAEWEPQEAIWLAFPHNPKNWNGERGKKIRTFYLKLIHTLSEFQKVNVLVPCEKFFAENEKCYMSNRPHTVNVYIIKNNDIWIRDYGPFFLKRGEKTCIKQTEFNAWGAKFPPWNLDNNVPSEIAKKLHFKHISSIPVIFEGGAIEVNGDGLGITTLDCLIGKNRNPDPKWTNLTKTIKRAFGLRDLLVLPHGLHGDHTDGHIDNVARFVAKDRIVMCEAESKQSPNAPILAEAHFLLKNWLELHYGKKARVDTLPLPPQRKLGNEILPASYMNFIYLNGALIFPKYKSVNDLIAKAYFEKIYPKRKVIGIDCRTVIEEGGSLHCLSKHQSK
ncbi:MAG: agmatine deiminase family protein [Fibrobacter sp.]|nr:agmatine deiminase family protein [Fibrobacter sp.]